MPNQAQHLLFRGTNEPQKPAASDEFSPAAGSKTRDPIPKLERRPEMTLTERLKQKAHAAGLTKESKDDVFDLMQQIEQCQQCCLLGNGGN